MALGSGLESAIQAPTIGASLHPDITIRAARYPSSALGVAAKCCGTIFRLPALLRVEAEDLIASRTIKATFRPPGRSIYRPTHDKIEVPILEDGEAIGKGQGQVFVAVLQEGMWSCGKGANLIHFCDPS